MAHLRVDFFSESLALSTSMTVLLPQRDHHPDRHDRREPRRPAARALPAARAERRRHDLAAPHLDRALRRAARAGGRHAAGAPQLLHRRGLRRPLLDVPVRGAAVAGRLFFRVSAGARTPSSPACRWAATARSSGRCGSPTGSPRPRACPARWTSPACAPGGSDRRTRGCSTGSSATRRRRHRRRPVRAAGPGRAGQRSAALPLLRDRGRAVRRQPGVRRRLRRRRVPVTTSLRPGRARLGVLGRRRSRTCWPGSRCGPANPPAAPARPAPPRTAPPGRPAPRRPAVVQDDVRDGAPLLVGGLRGDAGARVGLGQAAPHQPRDPGLHVGLDDEHEVVGARLAGLDQQRDVLDDDGVVRRAAVSSAGPGAHQRVDDAVEPRARRRRRRPPRPAPAGRASRPTVSTPGAERLDDGRQSRRAGRDHLAGEAVGVDDTRAALGEQRRARCSCPSRSRRSVRSAACTHSSDRPVRITER